MPECLYLTNKIFRSNKIILLNDKYFIFEKYVCCWLLGEINNNLISFPISYL